VTFASALPNGNYRLTIPAAAVADAAGNVLGHDLTLDFFVLAGDANRDRVVGIDDLSLLAQNYNKTGRTYATADFNNDGLTDIDDLNVLAQNYGQSVPAPPPALTVAKAAATQSAKPKPAKSSASPVTAKQVVVKRPQAAAAAAKSSLRR
jgi:hypothetical protein